MKTNNKHRKYKLLSNLENSSVVYDLIAESEHICFLLEHKVGDELYLFEKERNIFNGNIKFEYSILNLYEVGKKYVFDIINEKDSLIIVSNFSSLHFALPKAFRESLNQKRIELEIYDNDLLNNRPKFRNKIIESYGPTKDIDFSDFVENQFYDLDITNTYINKNGNRFVVCHFKGKEYHVSIPHTIAQSNLGQNIQVFKGYYKENNKPTLKPSRFYIVSILYKQDEKYLFTIDKQSKDLETGLIRWTLKDNYSMFHNYYPSNDMTFNTEMASLNENDEILLTVIKISNKGYLQLVADVVDWDKVNYLVEDVFEEIGYVDKEDEYFFKLRESQNDLTNDYDSEKERNFIEQYNDGENLWLFSYLSFLDIKIFQELDLGNYDAAIIFADIYIKIEKWILEGSDYLKNFSPNKTIDIINKAESKIEKLGALIEAINLYTTGNDQLFLEDIKISLERSPYLNKNKKNILKEIVKISQYFSVDTDDLLYDSIILLLIHGFIAEDERWIYAKSIENKIQRLKNSVLEHGESSNEADLKFLISNQYILVLLNVSEKNEVKACVSSVNLLRFLSLYYNDCAYIDLAINLIIRKTFLQMNVLKHKNIFNVSLSELEKSMYVSKSAPLIFGKSGSMYFGDAELKILPRNINKVKYDAHKIKLIDSFGKFNISVESSFELNTPNIEDEELIFINKLIDIINYKKVISKKNIEINEKKIYRGKIKSIGNDTNYCFLTAQIDEDKIDVLLHVNTFNRSRIFDNIDDYLKIHDRIQFEITKIEDERVSISSAILIENYSLELLKKPIITKGIVVKIFDQRTYVITTEGLPVVLFNVSYHLKSVLILEIKEYSSEFNHFISSRILNSDENFEEDPRELYREFLINCGVIFKNQKISENINNLRTEEEISDDESVNPIITPWDNYYKILSNQLIHCIEQRINFIGDTKQIALHYFLIITISGIIKSNKSFLYSLKLNNLADILRIKNNEISNFPEYVITSNFKGDDKPFSEESSSLEIMKYLKTDFTEIPLNTEIDSNIYTLKKLVESYNLFFKLDSESKILEYLKKIIVQELLNVNIKSRSANSNEFNKMLRDTIESDEEKSDEKDEVKTNLGSESKIKEFKSSFFYSASKESQEKVILRSIAGFLNSYEEVGSLFLGVNDSGEIIGLEQDLKFTENISTLDQYQNHIQSLIVAFFPKEVNATIDFIFHKSLQINYLEIIIPKFDRPIPLENEFYQRQGVQTRILKGLDLLDFINRKNKVNHFMVSNNNVENVKNIDEEKTGDYSMSESRFDYYKTHRKEGLISTSQLNSSENNLLGFLYIFSNNTYFISTSDEGIINYLFKIPITEKHKYGSILLCYDNACVNRLEVRSILNRPFNKFYMNAMSEHGNLMSVFISSPNDEIAISVKRYEKLYIKMYAVSKITEHRIIGLKGNCIVQEDFDQVASYHHIIKLPEEFNVFRRDSRQGLGLDIEKNKKLFQVLINYLDS